MPVITFEVLTLFPELVEAFASAALLGKAAERGVVEVHATNIRDFANDKHNTVDDTPFGGGAGMVMKAEPVVAALEAVQAQRGPMHRILLTPSAPRFDQSVAHRLAKLPRIALVCGRYEGIDDRVREHFIDECLSIGDFVLSGGEVAALAIVEAVGRLAEGFMGNPESAHSESFAADDRGHLLEYPQYTRPAVFRGHPVPEVLQGGNHEAIAAWRTEAARRRTWSLRPDLRAAEPLPADVRWHLVWQPETQMAAEVASVARTHGLSGVLLLEAEPEHVLSWTRAAQGQVAVTAFHDLRAVRRRFRQRSRTEPKVVVLVEPGAGGERETQRVGEVFDALRAAGPVSDVVVIPLSALGDDAKNALSTADAVFAPRENPSTSLAIGAGIAEPSRPSSPQVALADHALAALRGVTRSDSPDSGTLGP